MITHEDLIRYLTDDGYVFTYDENIEQEITEYENTLREEGREDALADLANHDEEIRAEERIKVLETINKYKAAINSEHVFIVDEHFVNSLKEQIRADERNKTIEECIRIAYTYDDRGFTVEDVKRITDGIVKQFERMKEGGEI